MNKYFNKILFSLFVLSFFIIPAKTFAATIPFNIIPTGTDRNFSCPNPPDNSSNVMQAYQNSGGNARGSYSIFYTNITHCASFDGTGFPYNSTVGTNDFEIRFVSGGDTYLSDNFYTSSGVLFSATPAPTDGITARTTPANTSTVGYNVEFSGTYTNSETYDALILWVEDDDTNQIYTNAYQLPLINGEDLPFNFTYPLSPNREYTYKLRLYDSSDSSYTDWTSDYTFSTSALATEPPAWTPETCDSIISDFSACVRNFVRETFYPNPESISQFNNLTLRNSVPFSYIYDIGNIYNELFNTASTQSMTITISTPIGNITLISASMISAIPLASTIKTVLGWLIYLFTAFTIYRIIINRTHS